MRRLLKILKRIFLVLVVLLLIIILPIGITKVVESTRAAFMDDTEKMLEDIDRIDYLFRHDFANLDHYVDEEEYTIAMENWRQKVRTDQSYSMDSFRIDVVKRVAALRDPHTIVYNYRELDPNTFPYRLEWYDSSFYLINGQLDGDEWLGSRVVRMGNLTSQELYDKLSLYANAPNPSGQAYFMRLFTAIPAVLRHEGITDNSSEVSMLVENNSGVQKELLFSAIPADGIGALQNYRRLSSKYAVEDYPLREQQAEKFYWFKYLEQENAYYLRYRQCESQGDIEAFWQALFAAIDDKRPDKLIIDVRNNPGGDSQNHVTLLDEIQKRKWLNRYGKLFLLTNRGTGSAAVSLTSQMEMFTSAILVGEAPMDRPSTTSDPTFFTLPHSKLTLLLPNIYSLHSFAGDERTEITPDWVFSGNPSGLGYIQDVAFDSIIHSSIDSFPGPVVDSLPGLEGSYAFSPLRNMEIFSENDTLKIDVDGMGTAYIYKKDSVFHSTRFNMSVLIDSAGSFQLRMNDGGNYQVKSNTNEPSIYQLISAGKTDEVTNKLKSLKDNGAHYVTRPLIQTWSYQAYKRDGLEAALAVNTINKSLFPDDPVVSIIDYELYEYAGGDISAQASALTGVLGKLLQRYYLILTTDRIMNDEYNAFIGVDNK